MCHPARIEQLTHGKGPTTICLGDKSPSKMKAASQAWVGLARQVANPHISIQSASRLSRQPTRDSHWPAHSDFHHLGPLVSRAQVWGSRNSRQI